MYIVKPKILTTNDAVTIAYDITEDMLSEWYETGSDDLFEEAVQKIKALSNSGSFNATINNYWHNSKILDRYKEKFNNNYMAFLKDLERAIRVHFLETIKENKKKKGTILYYDETLLRKKSQIDAKEYIIYYTFEGEDGRGIGWFTVDSYKKEIAEERIDMLFYYMLYANTYKV